MNIIKVKQIPRLTVYPESIHIKQWYFAHFFCFFNEPGWNTKPLRDKSTKSLVSNYIKLAKGWLRALCQECYDWDYDDLWNLVKNPKSTTSLTSKLWCKVWGLANTSNCICIEARSTRRSRRTDRSPSTDRWLSRVPQRSVMLPLYECSTFRLCDFNTLQRATVWLSQ